MVDDIDETRAVGRMAQGTYDEPLSEKRMRRIRDFDFLGLRVLEVGIKRWFLLTTWITATCGSFFNFGCVMACCYA